MKTARITVVLITLLLSLQVPAFSGTASFTLDEGAYNSVPQPRLRYPIYDRVSLEKGKPLVFQWWNDFAETSGFILKVYKGYNMDAANLILKKDLSPGVSSLEVSPDLFEDGQVYTWSLIRIAFAGHKSDKSFNSFKIIKK